jgi:hypothetical protein
VHALSDYPALHAAQAALIPESKELIYPPVYPPNTALAFVPFSSLSYLPAAWLWVSLTVAGYALFVYLAWRSVATTVPDGRLVAAAALAFPPLWQLVMNGQVTLIVLSAFALGWLMLERGRTFLAGAAFGLLASKPHLAIPLAAVVLFRREWSMMLGAIVAVALQAAAVVLWLDATALSNFAHGIPTMLASVDVLEAKPWAGHSLRTLTRLLPPWAGMPIWFATCDDMRRHRGAHVAAGNSAPRATEHGHTRLRARQPSPARLRRRDPRAFRCCGSPAGWRSRRNARTWSASGC